MNDFLRSVAGFIVLAFALSWLATQFVPPLSWHHIDVKEITTGLGPALAGLICYQLFTVPNTYRLSLAGSRPFITFGIVLLSIVLPILLTKQTDKAAFAGRVLTQFTYTFGEEFGWRHYLQNATSRLTRWKQAFVIGFLWFVWHYAILNDPTTMLTGQPIPFYVGIPLLLLLLSLLSKLFGDVVLRTQAVLLPTAMHYVGKVGGGYAVLIVYALVAIACLTWNRPGTNRQSAN